MWLIEILGEEEMIEDLELEISCMFYVSMLLYFIRLISIEFFLNFYKDNLKSSLPSRHPVTH